MNAAPFQRRQRVAVYGDTHLSVAAPCGVSSRLASPRTHTRALVTNHPLPAMTSSRALRAQLAAFTSVLAGVFVSSLDFVTPPDEPGGRGYVNSTFVGLAAADPTAS